MNWAHDKAPQKDDAFQECVERSVVQILESNFAIVGSGFFISPQGYLLTCYHVIKEQLGAPLTVRYQGNPIRATYISTISDPSSDIAILKIEGTSVEWLPIGDAQMDTPVRIWGFRRGFVRGYQISGILRHGQVLPGLRVRSYNLETSMPDSSSLSGTSGAPVYDPGLAWVVGMFSAEEMAGPAISYVLPMNAVIREVPSEIYLRYHTVLGDWIFNYLSTLRNGPVFTDFAHLRYFQLQLGKQQTLEMKLGLKNIPSELRKQYTVEEAIKKFQRLVMIGEPGSGKTTALMHIALTFADRLERAMNERGAGGDIQIPVYIWIPHFNLLPEGSPQTRFEALIQESFRALTGELPGKIFAELITKSRMILLLDGLNEVGENNREIFLTGLESFAGAHAQHAIVVSSRTYNFRFDKNDLPVLQLLELEYPEGVEQYIESYIPSPSTRRRVMHIIEENFQMRRLAVNPLLLMLILLVYTYEAGNVLASRGRLLSKLASGLLGRWQLHDLDDPEQVEPRFWFAEKELLLAELGYAMKAQGLEMALPDVQAIFKAAIRNKSPQLAAAALQRPPRFQPIDKDTNWTEFIRELRRDRVLVDSGGKDSIRFWHQTMQEYFAARYIWSEIRPMFSQSAGNQTLSKSRSRALARKFRLYINSQSWHEILAIVAGLVDENEADDRGRIVADFIGRIWRQNWLLAAMCIGNAEPCNEVQNEIYVEKIARQLYRWIIVIPRLCPLVVLTVALAVLWYALPTPAWLPSSRVSVRIAENVGAMVGAIGTVLFFLRFYAAMLNWLERITAKHFVRPAIAALGHIRDDASEIVLAAIGQQIVNEFSVGEVTRLTISSARYSAMRSESELIVMLRSKETRDQALLHLHHRATVRSIGPLFELMEQPELSDESFQAGIGCLVAVSKLQNQLTREHVTDRLKILAINGADYNKRLAAYKALLEMGERDADPPQRSVVEFVLDHSVVSIVVISVFLAVLIVYWTFM
jgi:Trypsin-like peptidase domain